MPVGKLYMSNVSPPVRAVLLLEKALNIELEHVEVSPMAGDLLKPEYLKLNPQHTIPVYVDQDGTTIWDSHAINAYLVGKYAKTDSLYPKDLGKRAVVDQRLHFDSGNVFPVLLNIGSSFWKLGAKEVSPQQAQLVAMAYEFLDKFLDGQQWIACDQLTIADFSLIASISSLDCVIPIDAEKYPNLCKWMAKCKGLSYYDVNEAGLIKFRGFLQAFLNK